MNNEERIKSHIGETYGDYTIIDFTSNGIKTVYIGKCKICGHVLKRPIAEFKRIPPTQGSEQHSFHSAGFR